MTHRTVIELNLVSTIKSHSFQQINLKWYTDGLNLFLIKLFFRRQICRMNFFSILKSWKLRLTPHKKVLHTVSPEGTQLRLVSAQWVRTIRSLAPVRGLTRTSIPPPFHWCQEKCSQTSSQETWIFFSPWFSLSLSLSSQSFLSFVFYNVSALSYLPRARTSDPRRPPVFTVIHV
jgi:hypothetical protein